MTSSSHGINISLGSFNCRGLNEIYKRADIFDWLRKKRLDICILVDTHCSTKAESKWKEQWGGDIYFSSVESNKRGIAVLFKKGFPYEFHSSKCILDNNAIILDLTIGIMKITLI